MSLFGLEKRVLHHRLGPPGDDGDGPGLAADADLNFTFPQPWDAAAESPSQELKDERPLVMKVDFNIV